jgi:hypothetical protein
MSVSNYGESWSATGHDGKEFFITVKERKN